MIEKIFPSRAFIRIGLACLLLMLVTMSCGGAAAPAPSEPEEEPAPSQEEPAATQPAPTQSILPTDILDIPSGGGGLGTPEPPALAITERRRLTLEYPAQIRTGDSDVVRLTLEVDELGNITPTAQFGGNVVTGDVVEIPDLYESHHVIAETRFDVAGLQVSPPELVSQTLSRGQELNFFWSVRPQEVGVYRGTIWFYLRFVDKVGGEESQRAVSVQVVEIEAVNFLGLSGQVVRTIGGIGSLIGTVIGFPFFEDIVRFLFKKRAKKRR